MIQTHTKQTVWKLRGKNYILIKIIISGGGQQTTDIVLNKRGTRRGGVKAQEEGP